MTAPSSFSNPFPPETEERWRSVVARASKGAPFASLTSRTADGIVIAPLSPRAPERPIAGARAGEPWQIMARVDYPDVAAANAMALADLNGGATGLVLSPAGAPAARGFGIRIVDASNLDAALSGVEIDLIQMRLDPSPQQDRIAAALAALVKRRRLSPEALRIDFGFDPGVDPDPAGASGRLAAATSALQAEGFQGAFLTADGRIWHDAGASEAQELGLILAVMAAHLRQLERDGWEAKAAISALSAVVSMDADQFLGHAKIRALRLLQEALLEACGLPLEPLVIHAETSWRMMTQRDPWTNLLRATIATFSAGVGGADTVTIIPFTQAQGLPDAFARRIARNTQHILLDESHLWRVIDPAAGSGAIEALTNGLAEHAWGFFQSVEQAGGFAPALASGLIQKRIAEQRDRRLAAIHSGAGVILGTNRFPNHAEQLPGVLASVRLQGSDLTVAGLMAQRDAVGFERLRDRAEALLGTGRVPLVTPVVLDDDAGSAERLSFLRQTLDLAGVRLGEAVIAGDAARAGRDLRQLGSPVVALCMSPNAARQPAEDATHPLETQGDEWMRALRAAGAAHLLVLGLPSEHGSGGQGEVADAFLYRGCDLTVVLAALLDVWEGMA